MDYAYTIRESITGDDVITTAQHVITVYDRGAVRVRVARNSVSTPSQWDVWTSPDDDDVGLRERELRALLQDDIAAIVALLRLGVLPMLGVTMVIAPDAWRRDDATKDACDAACMRMERYLDTCEGPAFCVHVRPVYTGCTAGTYYGDWASHTHRRIPHDQIPTALHEAIDRAFIHACETWPEATEA